MNYQTFLAAKQRRHGAHGRACTPAEVSPLLYDWQREGVAWAVRKGRAALWWSTGLGKTRAQIEWCRLSGTRSLIVAPLAVCHQTVREGSIIDAPVTYARNDAEAVGPGIWITNYERVERFDPALVDAVALDESSILKQASGKTRIFLTEYFSCTPLRLVCTATPAPNAPEELANQAHFLGVMPRSEMLSHYFVHDEMGWRLKGHGRLAMYQWLTSWAMAMRTPSDLGYPDTGYILPQLRILPEIVHVEMNAPDGQLFRADIGGVGGRAQVRRETLNARVDRAVELVKTESDEPWLLWAGLNAEADALAAGIPGAVNVEGNWKPEDKAAAYLAFADGKIRYLITKPSMAALGLNFQHCARMAFVGMNDSWELWFQAIRRCHRYGQTREVHVHAVLSQLETQIAANVERKGRQADLLIDGMIIAMRERWKHDD